MDLPSLSWEAAPEEPAKPSSPLFRDFMRDHMLGIRAKEVAYGTWKREEIVWRTRVWPSELGKKPIQEITRADCQSFIDAQTTQLKAEFAKDDRGKVVKDKQGEPTWTVVDTGEPLKRVGVKRIGTCVSPYFAFAMSQRGKKLLEANPMQGVEYPKERKGMAKRRKSLTPQAAAGLQANLLKFSTAVREQGPRFEAMVMTGRDTGFRPGEICGLKWSQIRRVGKVCFIVVDSGQVRVKGGVADSSTKTDRVREVPIAESTYERLMAQPRRSEYVFTTASGKPVRRDNYTRDFRIFREAIGMPELTPHNLRHTYISLMLRAGVDLKTIQKNVGHASPRMIMEIYGETFDESQVESVGRFFSVLNQAVENAA